MVRVIINQTLGELIPAAILADHRHIELEAGSVRELLQQLERLAPGISARLSTMAVAIDGDIEADAALLPLTPGSEVCFVPAIEGG